MTQHDPTGDGTADTAPRPEDIEDQGYARDAWLSRRVIEHVDHDVNGAYTWEPDAYTPVAVDKDGSTGLVFAKT